MTHPPILGSRPFHPIGIGTFGMGGGNRSIAPGEVFGTPYRDDTDTDRHVTALRHSLTAGQTFIDTAAMYGNGLAEEIVGRAIRGQHRCRLTIASKIRRETLQQPHTMTAAVRDMIERLELADNQLDLLYIHSPNYPGTVTEDYMRALNVVADLGLTRAIGVCNFNLTQLKQAMELSYYPIAAIQNLYSPLYHHDGGNKATFTPELQAFCHEHGILMVAHTPLHAGHAVRHPALRGLARDAGLAPAQLVLAWIRARDIVPIPKASTLAHIDENVAAADIELEAELCRRIDQLASVDLSERGIIAAASPVVVG